MAEFQWWLLLLGLVVGGGLVAVVFLDAARQEADIAAEELRAEAIWIAEQLRGSRDAAQPSQVQPSQVQPSLVQHVLELHRAYLQEPPPDVVEDRTADAPARPASDT